MKRIQQQQNCKFRIKYPQESYTIQTHVGISDTRRNQFSFPDTKMQWCIQREGWRESLLFGRNPSQLKIEGGLRPSLFSFGPPFWPCREFQKIKISGQIRESRGNFKFDEKVMESHRTFSMCKSLFLTVIEMWGTSFRVLYQIVQICEMFHLHIALELYV